jgi:uncharacterized membrane protein
MKRKLLTGLIVLLVIAASFFMIMLTAGAAIAVWIYLAWMVLKKKTEIFHAQMEPKLAERRLKMLKASLLVAAIAFLGGIAGVIGHNAVYAATETEEAVFFFIALSTIWLFTLATGGGLIIFLKGRRKLA